MRSPAQAPGAPSHGLPRRRSPGPRCDNPGTTAAVWDAGGSGNITVSARSNGNYSLDLNLSRLDHVTHPSANMANSTVSARGGDLASYTPFPGFVYLYGGASSYRWAYNDTQIFNTTDVDYQIAIPLGQTPGDYEGTLHYHLRTQDYV